MNKEMVEGRSGILADTIGEAPTAGRLDLRALLWVGIPALLGLWIQLTSYPNHDVAWVLWGSQQMLHGAQYGRDIIEPNPPLAWYLSMPTTALAEWLGVQIDQTFRIALMALAVLSSLSMIVLKPVRMSQRAAAILAGLATISLITISGREFGQREPMAMIFVLPYLALAGRRFDGGKVPSAAVTVLIGIFGGLGFAMKPYFLAVPALIELLLLIKPRNAKLFRPENVAAAAVIAVYGAYVLMVEKTYLSSVIPMVREIYWSFDRSPRFIFTQYFPMAIGSVIFAVESYRRRCGFALVMAAAFIGFSFSYFIQAKGYDYHLVPVRVTSLLLAAVFMLDEATLFRRRIFSAILVVLYLMLWGAQFGGWWQRAQPGGELYREIEQINRSIANHARGSTFFVITVRTYPNFPAGIYAPAGYAAKANAQWFLPAVSQLRAKGVPSRSIENRARESIAYSLSFKPRLILLDTNSKGHTIGPRNFDILGFYLEDPAFRAEWANYREIEPIGQFRQFVRKNPSKTPARDAEIAQ